MAGALDLSVLWVESHLAVFTFDQSLSVMKWDVSLYSVHWLWGGFDSVEGHSPEVLRSACREHREGTGLVSVPLALERALCRELRCLQQEVFEGLTGPRLLPEGALPSSPPTIKECA